MPDRPTFAYDVFLSYNSKDRPSVGRLAERLREAGLRVWWDRWILKPGEEILLAIERGLQESRVLVLCLSPDALKSDWVGLERSTVLFRDPANVERRFVPLLLAECEIPDTLRRYEYLDYRRHTAAVFARLVEACRAPTEEPRPCLPPRRRHRPPPNQLPRSNSGRRRLPPHLPLRKRKQSSSHYRPTASRLQSWNERWKGTPVGYIVLLSAQTENGWLPAVKTRL